ncbi:MAG: DUF188 domain-containing protein [Spirochaetaceae bacterium]|jgi:uncharacterized protein YaiI (UPF0178 family)|nr:DUF188 domain-containing protein [Spirochaetaceae bacterium]
MKILVDADSCPAIVREVILKAANRLGTPALFAANRKIPGLWGTAVMELCSEEEGAADNRIVELACQGDIAITRDIPLARRLVEKSVYTMDDKGRIFTKENIGEYYSIRCFQIDIIKTGANITRPHNYNKKNLKSFADSFDKLLTCLIKTQRVFT